MFYCEDDEDEYAGTYAHDVAGFSFVIWERKRIEINQPQDHLCINSAKRETLNVFQSGRISV